MHFLVLFWLKPTIKIFLSTFTLTYYLKSAMTHLMAFLYNLFVLKHPIVFSSTDNAMQIVICCTTSGLYIEMYMHMDYIILVVWLCM